MQILFSIFLFVLGACLGSFLCCQARRLHSRSRHHAINNRRSICLSCKRQLKWYDNVPIFSWLFLKGKCRQCGSKIGCAELLSELGLAFSFLVLGINFCPCTATLLAWAIFLSVLFLTTCLAFLAIYDGLYGELPTIMLAVAIVAASISLIFQQWQAVVSVGFSATIIWSPILSVGLLGGLYLLLYLISKGKWVGDGDWLLGTAIGLALADPWLASIALFIANLLACLIMLPFVQKTKQSKIHFGPFMVLAFIITFAFSGFFVLQ